MFDLEKFHENCEKDGNNGINREKWENRGKNKEERQQSGKFFHFCAPDR